MRNVIYERSIAMISPDVFYYAKIVLFTNMVNFTELLNEDISLFTSVIID